MRQGAHSCRTFGRSLAANLDDFLGRRGVNGTMLGLYEAAQLVFDWRHLAAGAPEKNHFEALFRLVALLEPILRTTLWPTAPAFPHVLRAWPELRGPNGWFWQYQELGRRVRRAARNPCLCRRWGWWRIQSWVVRPVARTTAEASLGRLPQWRFGWCAAARSHACELIGEFAGLPGVSAGSPGAFGASISALASLGNGARLRGSRGKRAEYTFRGGVGSIASLAAPPGLVGKVVCVVGAKRDLDENALEASLIATPSFTTAAADGRGHCYHVVRVAHRVRMLRAMESCCERWGSIVHQLWDGTVAWHPSRIAARLLMREAGLAQNSPFAEAVAQEIAQYLAERRGMNPIVQRRSRREAAPAAPVPVGVQLAMRRALRESTHSRDEAKAAAQPESLGILQPAAQIAVARAVHVGKDDCLQALPMFYQDQRVIARGGAPSTEREALESWLASPESAAWRASRTAIFGTGLAPQAPPCLALPSEDPGAELALASETLDCETLALDC